MDLLEATHQRLDLDQMTGFSVRRKHLLRNRKTILLAEDDNDLRYVMELTLTAMGYNVVACPNADVAFAAFRSQPCFDILLTDFEMPGKSGLELAREVAALSPSLPIMIITGSMLSLEALLEIHDRQWIYVSKPCHLHALKSTLNQLLNSSRPQTA